MHPILFYIAASDQRYTFKKALNQGSIFTIDSVTESDHSKYLCVATLSGDSGKKLTKEFVLRVREGI